MTAPSVGGSAVPSSLASGGEFGGGRYRFHKQPQRQAGAGNIYGYGDQYAEWTWVRMGTTEYEWWKTQYARGTAMAFELWEDDTRRTTISFTTGILHRPEHRDVEAGRYVDAKITISYLLPIQS